MARIRSIVLATAALVVAAAPAALGHAAYESSVPGDGSTVASPPSSVTAEFTEPLGRGGGSGPRNRPGGTAETSPVAFRPAGDSLADEPAPWDLPVSGVVLALALCVMIGAAGGRVYAGIVAPPRR